MILFFALFMSAAISVNIVIFLIKNIVYKNSAYYEITKLTYLDVIRDTGRYGEYLTYKNLRGFENSGAKFLFNVYIPKENGTTTEIDVLMLCSKGVFVFESKNYSGWIFGSENQKNWYQTLPKGRGRSQKECFYNPIMQNNSHIKSLKAFLGNQIPMWSIVVFSDRCTLKNVRISGNKVSVIKRNDVASTVTSIRKQIPSDSLSEGDVAELYAKLYPCTQVTDDTKAQHIANIRDTFMPQTADKACLSVKSTVQTEAAPTKTDEELSAFVASNETGSHTTENTPQEADKPPSVAAKDDEPDIQKCPRCGGDLVLRTAARGKNAGNSFYGCSNYPKCKYILEVK